MRRDAIAPFVLASMLLAAQGARADGLGLNVHQSSTVGLDTTRDATLHWVRIDLNWYDVEPTEGAFDFSRIDPVVDGAKSRGLEVLAVLAYTPAWASTGDKQGGGSQNDVPIAGKYQAFVTATVAHYAGKVTHYEIWNEPNLGGFFEGTTQDYTSLILVPGADAVHAACAACKVVAPGLASIANAYDTWLDASLTAAAAKIDIASGHVYAAFPQDDAQAGVTKDSFFNKLDQHRKIVVGGVVVYEGPLSYKEVLDKHAFTKPFWLTETGAQAAYGDTTAEAAQTLQYRRTMESMIARPWWETTIFYEAFDEPNTGYTYGVVLHDDTAPGGYHAKPVMDLLKKAGPSVHFGGTGPECSDGLDDDGDGLVDYPADPDCASANGASEGMPIVDGGVGTDGSAGADATTGGADSGAGGGSGDVGAPGAGAEPRPGAGAAPGTGSGGCRVGSATGFEVAPWLGVLAALAARRRSRRGRTHVRTSAFLRGRTRLSR